MTLPHMITLESAKTWAQDYGFVTQKTDDGRLYIWRYNLKKPEKLDEFSTLISDDGRVSTTQLMSFLKECRDDDKRST